MSQTTFGLPWLIGAGPTPSSPRGHLLPVRLHMAFPARMSVSVQIFPFYKGQHHTGLGLILMTSFYIDYL